MDSIDCQRLACFQIANSPSTSFDVPTCQGRYAFHFGSYKSTDDGRIYDELEIADLRYKAIRREFKSETADEKSIGTILPWDMSTLYRMTCTQPRRLSRLRIDFQHGRLVEGESVVYDGRESSQEHRLDSDVSMCPLAANRLLAIGFYSERAWRDQLELSVWDASTLERRHTIGSLASKVQISGKFQDFYVNGFIETPVWFACVHISPDQGRPEVTGLPYHLPSIFEWQTDKDIVRRMPATNLDVFKLHKGFSIYSASGTWKGTSLYYLLNWTTERDGLTYREYSSLFVYNIETNAWRKMRLRFPEPTTNVKLAMDLGSYPQTPLLIQYWEWSGTDYQYFVYRLPLGRPEKLADLTHYKALTLGFFRTHEERFREKAQLHTKLNRIREAEANLKQERDEYAVAREAFEERERLVEPIYERVPTQVCSFDTLENF